MGGYNKSEVVRRMDMMIKRGPDGYREFVESPVAWCAVFLSPHLCLACLKMLAYWRLHWSNLAARRVPGNHEARIKTRLGGSQKF